MHVSTMSREFDVFMCLSCHVTEHDVMSEASPKSTWRIAQVDLCDTSARFEEYMGTAVGANNIRFSLIVAPVACLQHCSCVSDSTVLLPFVINVEPLQCAAAH